MSARYTVTKNRAAEFIGSDGSRRSGLDRYFVIDRELEKPDGAVLAWTRTRGEARMIARALNGSGIRMASFHIQGPGTIGQAGPSPIAMRIDYAGFFRVDVFKVKGLKKETNS